MAPTEEQRAQFLAKHFVGEAFRDELFNIENNEREKACAWKIHCNGPLFTPLTSGCMWLWRAVGLPLHLIDRSLEGDIDLMFALRGGPEHRDGQRIFPEPTYRCFELKTSKVTRSGEVKSLKEGKFHKTRAQLEKLCAIGAPQVFLLEAFIVEAGFTVSEYKMPDAVRNSVGRKYDQITRADYGYVALAIEQIKGFSEADTGLLWPVETIKGAISRPLTAPFSNFVSMIEAYATRVGARGYAQVVTYCNPCKSLTWVHHKGPYVCRECGCPLI
jgi:hypothetical protein